MKRGSDRARQTHRIEAGNELIVFAAGTLVIVVVIIVVVTVIVIVAASGINCI